MQSLPTRPLYSLSSWSVSHQQKGETSCRGVHDLVVYAYDEVPPLWVLTLLRISSTGAFETSLEDLISVDIENCSDAFYCSRILSRR